MTYVVIGNQKESPKFSVVIGQNASALFDFGIAIGSNALSDGIGAIAIGSNAIARGKGTIAIGDGILAVGDGEIVVGSLRSVDRKYLKMICDKTEYGDGVVNTVCLALLGIIEAMEQSQGEA